MEITGIAIVHEFFYSTQGFILKVSPIETIDLSKKVKRRNS